MAKLNVTYPAVNVLVNGVEYRKVDRKAQAGDIVKALVRALDVEVGAFYKVEERGFGLFFRDGAGDVRSRYLNRDGHVEVYEPVPQSAAKPSDEITLEDATYRKVDRDAREGDVIVITELDDEDAEVTVGKPYVVERIDWAGDPQITDNGGDEYDTAGDEFDVYEKVSGAVAEVPAQQYREVKRKAAVGERIKIVEAFHTYGNYAIGDELTVKSARLDGAVYVREHGCVIAQFEYVVLVPVDKAEGPAPYSAGDYVKVMGNSVHHNYEIGSVVKITETKDNAAYGGQQFSAEKADGERGNWLVTIDVEPAKKPEPKRLTVGGYYKVVREGGAHNYAVGSVVKVTEVYDKELFYAEKSDGSRGNLLALKQVEPATETEFLAQRKPKLIPVGEYGKITQVGITRGEFNTHRFRMGETVKVIGHAYHYDDRVHAKSEETGDTWYVHYEDITAISAGEVAKARVESTKPKPEFSVGDSVKLVIAEGKSPYYGWGSVKNGDVGTVTYANSEKLTVKFPKQHTWNGLPSEFVKLTPEEAAAIEKERAETEKWAKIGRKVDEFKRGDFVTGTDDEDGVVSGSVEDISVSLLGVRATSGKYFAVRTKSATLIVPVEQRFDNEVKSAA